MAIKYERECQHYPDFFYQDYALTTLDLSSWRVKGAWSAGDKVFPTYTYTNSAAQSQLKSIKFGSGWTGKVVLPTFQLSATEYGTWRGEQHDKQYVSGAGTVKETYQPPTDASARTDTFRFAYDVIAKLEDNQGNPIQLAGVPIIVQDSNGKEVMRGTTGADGTVTVPINATDGDYTVKLGDLPGGYEAVTDTRTATINGDDVTVTLVVDKQNDSNLIKQYPHAGGHGTFLTVVAGALAVVLGTTGMLARRRA
ncbi:SpaA isopeptide-forming pilin-related protein [Lacticaseibacillus thailandensis]|uniref:SpaA isopeptide-forming pilin-related protein n=1 Tax=Lacticaseibacillus thailandensis TaxID=381741 RepID=UPI00138F120D|nr:SpaA isopeptide-forming pilin-related protein [Lacticaseibacillus thailandensis]